MMLPLATPWTKPDWLVESYWERLRFDQALVDCHKDSVQERFPEFRVVLDRPWGVVWRGVLQPIAQPYQVLVTFFPELVTRDLHFAWAPPRVYLLDPAPERRPEAPEERIPHLYRQPAPGLPAHLCLYYPDGREWRLFDWIGKSIIPWASEWLMYYELWRATGIWHGPGRHPEPNAVKTDHEERHPGTAGGATRKEPAWLRPRPLLASLDYRLRQVLGAMPQPAQVSKDVEWTEILAAAMVRDALSGQAAASAAANLDVP